MPETKKERKEISDNLNILAKSSFFVFFALFLSKVFTYLYRIIIARSLGPEVYGLFALAFMVFGWFVSVFSLGIFEGLLRFVSINNSKKEYEKVSFLKSLSFKILFFSSIASALLLFYLSELISIKIFNEPNLVIYLKFFAIAVPFMIFSNAFLSIIRANEKVKIYSFGQNILNNGFRLIALIILIYTGIKTNAVILSFLSGIIVLFIFSYLYSRTKVEELFSEKKLSASQKSNISREFLNYSWPLLFFAIINELFFWIDTFSIGYLLDATQVGFYNAAIPIALLLYIAPELFVQMFFPLITKEYSQRKTKIVKELTKQVGKWIFLINLPLLFLLLLFPEIFIKILFGQEYLVAANSLRILSIGSFCFAFTRISEQLIRAIGKPRILLTNIVIISGINLALNAWLIPIYGIDGAAIATTISFFILSIVVNLEFKVLLGYLPLRRKMVGVLAASILSSSIFFFMNKAITPNLFGELILVSFYLLLYILLIFLFKSFDRNDITTFRNLFKI